MSRGLKKRFSDARDRRKLEDLDREEATQSPRDHEWARPVSEPELTDNFWIDPEPECSGVLTADRIRAYHYLTGRMIRPFQEDNLNPASYDLTLGPRCVIDGEEVTLSHDRSTLRIPPSSIAFVTSREMLFIPHWLVATFNLKSQYIFDGLLMGVGPQIDPGFMGVLTCPIHNISSHPIKLKFCEPFAKLDFVKTTWGREIKLDRIADENELYYRGGGTNRSLAARDGEPAKLWPKEKNFPNPLMRDYSEGAQSSLRKLENDVGTVRKRTRVAGIVSLGSPLAVVAIVIAIATMVSSHIDTRVDDLRNDNAAAMRAEINKLMKARIAQNEKTAGYNPDNAFD